MKLGYLTIIVLFFVLYLEKSLSNVIYTDATFGNNNGVYISQLSKFGCISDIKIKDDSNAIALANLEEDSILLSFTTKGQLDENFGKKGIAKTLFAKGSISKSLLIDAKKRFVLAGFTGREKSAIVLSRNLENGAPDATFGNQGIATIALPGSAVVNDMISIKDECLLIAGSCNIGGMHQGILVKLTKDGILDHTFADKGIFFLQECISHINSIKVDKNNGIIIGGYLYQDCINKLFIARLQKNGTLDSNFGDEGIVRADIASRTSTQLTCLDITADGKIIGTGSADNTIFVAKYHSNGLIDESFGSNGFLTMPFHGRVDVCAFKIEKNGTFIITGRAEKKAFIIKILPNGCLDTEFGDLGIIFSNDKHIYFPALAIKSSGEILVGGRARAACLIAQYIPSNLPASFLHKDLVNSFLETHTTKLYGYASRANAQIKITINNALFKTVNTDEYGLWNAGLSPLLNNGDNKIKLELLANANIEAINEYNLRVKAIDNISLAGLENNQVVTTLPFISGTASKANARIQLYIDDMFINEVLTDNNGNWNLPLANKLINGQHIVKASLVTTWSTLATVSKNINLQDKDVITIVSPSNNYAAFNDISISGTSSRAASSVLIFVNGSYVKRIFTDKLGNWDAKKISKLPIGDAIITAQLISDSGTVLATVSNFIQVK